jgi:tRNA (mo5U34)-methyltransferase
MDIQRLKTSAIEFRDKLHAIKRDHPLEGNGWYPYGTLDNFPLLDALLPRGLRDLGPVLQSGPAVDIGAADGDTAFFMETQGIPMHVVDFPPTNFNGCRGVHRLKALLHSSVEILEVDLDRQFSLPQQRYTLAFFLGILYHLKNPFGALEALSAHAQYAFLSTRVARYNVAARAVGSGGVNPERLHLRDAPVGYLVDAAECNNDDTNYWIFSEAGLRRLLHRTGWDVLAYRTFGNTSDSDPARNEGDERAFVFMKSRRI